MYLLTDEDKIYSIGASDIMEMIYPPVSQITIQMNGSPILLNHILQISQRKKSFWIPLHRWQQIEMTAMYFIALVMVTEQMIL